MTKSRSSRQAAQLSLALEDPQPYLDLDDEDAAAIRRARAAIRAGRTIPMDRLLKRLPA